MDELVSVIMPAYNTGKFIEKSIESFLEQTWKHKELIIINDASTDNTSDILEKYRKYNNIIILENEKNCGVSFSRNRGLDIAKGSYIALLDSDDYMHPTKLERQIEFFTNNPSIDVVFTDTFEIDDFDTILQRTYSDFISTKLFLPMMLYRNVISPAPATIMYKSYCLKDVRYNEKLTVCEDYYLNLNLAFKNYKFDYLAEPLYYYRRHQENLTNKFQKMSLSEKIIDKFLNQELINNAFQLDDLTNYEKEFVTILKGKFELKRENYNLALEILENIEPSDKELKWAKYFYLGVANYYRKNFKVSFDCFLQCQDIEEKAEVFNNLAVVGYAINHIDQQQIEKWLNRAIDLRPEYLDAKNNLVLLKENSKNLKLTNRELRKSLVNYKNT